MYCCFMNSSGYSQAAQNYLFALNKTNQFDIKLKIFGDRPTRPAISDENYEFFISLTRKEDNNRILIYHCIPTIQRRVQSKNRNIGFATFETFDPPETWIDILNQNDAIIVPSRFNFKIFSHMRIKKPIYYIPHCIDFDIYNRNVKPLYKYDKFTFLFMGIWRERKGYKQLLEAWLSEFTDKDNVQLVIKTDKIKQAENYFYSLRKQMGINKGFAPIIFENKIFDENLLPKFVKSVDCLIAPTLGEGYYLPGLQCMGLGVPVIITDFSGCQDYANNDTANLIEPSGFILKSNMDNIPQFRNKKWAFLEVAKIRKIMRKTIMNYEESKLKANVAYSYVRKNFNYNIIGNIFVNMIKELYG